MTYRGRLSADCPGTVRPREAFNINRPFMPVEQIEISLSNLGKIG